jgi:hypothetical protein
MSKRQRVEARKPSPFTLLLPLLPPVQILFASFCPASKTKPAQRNTTKKELSKDHIRKPSPVTLCYLCFLLFKSSLPTSVRPQKPSPPNVTRSKRICRRTIAEAQSGYPLLPLLPSVQILFADFCPPSKTKSAQRNTIKKDLSKDHRGSPVRLPFVTFASFCSNPLCRLLSALKDQACPT